MPCPEHGWPPSITIGSGPAYWSGTTHRQVLLWSPERSAWVDEGIAMAISDLWDAGLDTWVSCQGSRKHAGYVGIEEDDPDPATNSLVVAILVNHHKYVEQIERDRLPHGGCNTFYYFTNHLSGG